MTPTNETRILKAPSLLARYAIVSMPRTAWYWLDDLVKRDYPQGGYRALIQAFEKAETQDTTNPQIHEALSAHLSAMAKEHCDSRMVSLYNLSNDNAGNFDAAVVINRSERPDYSLRLPAVYRLFRFMPHATYLTTVWERRNYHLRQSSPKND